MGTYQIASAFIEAACLSASQRMALVLVSSRDRTAGQRGRNILYKYMIFVSLEQPIMNFRKILLPGELKYYRLLFSDGLEVACLIPRRRYLSKLYVVQYI